MRSALVLGVLLGAVVVGCGGSKPNPAGSGGSGGGGGATTSVTTTTATTTTSGAGGSGGGMVCEYPESATEASAYFPAAGADGLIFPLPGEEKKGASASRRGPWATERTVSGIRLVTSTSGITSVPVDVWTQVGKDPGTRVPVYQILPVVSTTTDGPRYVYTFAFSDLVVPVGQSVFAATPLNAYVPYAYFDGDCYDETVTWWYGLPITTDGTPTWATLLSPKDPSVDSYKIDFTTTFLFKP